MPAGESANPSGCIRRRRRLAVCLLFAARLSLAAEDQDYELDWYGFNGGGGVSTDGFFMVEATLGQVGAGLMSDGQPLAEGYRFQGGFWAAALPAPPFLGMPLASITTNIGATLTFNAEANGTPPLFYQWRLNGVHLPGETNRMLTLTNVQVPLGGVYTWVVFSASGVTSSAPAELRLDIPQLPINPPNAPPANDHFADRIRIALTNFTASNRGATRESGEPAHAGRRGSNSVWFTWSTNANGIATFDTRGSAFDTLLAVYTGDSLGTLVGVTADDDRGGFLTSEVQFNVTSNTPYALAIDGLAGRQGNYVLNWHFEATDQSLPRITRHPRSRAVPPLGVAEFWVVTAGPAVSYQWRHFGTNLHGETASNLVIQPALPHRLGWYDVVVRNQQDRHVVSRPAVLEFGPKPGAVFYSKLEDLVLDSESPESADPSSPDRRLSSRSMGQALSSTSSILPDNWIPVSVGVIDHQDALNDLAFETSACGGCGAVGGKAMYLGFYTTHDGVLALHTLGSTSQAGQPLDTTLRVYANASRNAFRATPNEVCGLLVGCDDNSGPDGSSRLSVSAVADWNYVVVVDSVGGETGTVVLTWQLGPIASPVEYVGTSLYLQADTNLLLYGEPQYTWLTNGTFYLETTQPQLRLDGPFGAAVTYAVAMEVQTMTTQGVRFDALTNTIGMIFRAVAAPISPSDERVFQVTLDGIQPAQFHAGDFQAEMAVASEANGVATWSWQAVTNYLPPLTNSDGSLILRFPSNERYQFFRVRPKSE